MQMWQNGVSRPPPEKARRSGFGEVEGFGSGTNRQGFALTANFIKNVRRNLNLAKDSHGGPT